MRAQSQKTSKAPCGVVETWRDCLNVRQAHGLGGTARLSGQIPMDATWPSFDQIARHNVKSREIWWPGADQLPFHQQDQVVYLLNYNRFVAPGPWPNRIGAAG